MGRPTSKVSKTILSLPHDMSVKDVLGQLKSKGLKTTESNIYRVRRLLKKRATKRTAPVTAVTSSSAEGLLRAVAAEVGLGRAIEILEAERSRVRTLIG